MSEIKLDIYDIPCEPCSGPCICMLGWNTFLDKLNVYNDCKTLTINIDGSVIDLPDNIKKFKNLKTLNISGSRCWKLTIQNIPSSITTLDLSETVNLDKLFLSMLSSDSDSTPNLKTLILCDEIFDIEDLSESESLYEYEDTVKPLNYIASLKNINIHIHNHRCFNDNPIRENVENLIILFLYRYTTLGYTTKFVWNDSVKGSVPILECTFTN